MSLNLISSLENNFKASPKGWKEPNKKTLFGPKRKWPYPKILRSNKVKKATDNKTKSKINKTLENKTIFKRKISS